MESKERDEETTHIYTTLKLAGVRQPSKPNPTIIIHYDWL